MIVEYLNIDESMFTMNVLKDQRKFRIKYWDSLLNRLRSKRKIVKYYTSEQPMPKDPIETPSENEDPMAKFERAFNNYYANEKSYTEV